MNTTHIVALVIGFTGCSWIIFSFIVAGKNFWSNVVFRVFPFFSGLVNLIYALYLFGIVRLPNA